jgi:hypothetical protein
MGRLSLIYKTLFRGFMVTIADCAEKKETEEDSGYQPG